MDQPSEIVWTSDEVAGVKVQRSTGSLGNVQVAAVEFDGSNRLWIWPSPLSESAWGWAPSEGGAKQAASLWLRQWLESFRSFMS